MARCAQEKLYVSADVLELVERPGLDDTRAVTLKTHLLSPGYCRRVLEDILNKSTSH